MTLRGLEAVLRSDVDDPRVVEVVAESVFDVAVGVEVLRYRSLEAAAHIEPRAVVVEGDIRTLGGRRHVVDVNVLFAHPFTHDVGLEITERRLVVREELAHSETGTGDERVNRVLLDTGLLIVVVAVRDAGVLGLQLRFNEPARAVFKLMTGFKRDAVHPVIVVGIQIRSRGRRHFVVGRKSSGPQNEVGISAIVSQISSVEKRSNAIRAAVSVDGLIVRAAVHVVDCAAPDHLAVFGRLRVIVAELIGRVVGAEVAHTGIGSDVFILHAGPDPVVVLIVDAISVALIEAVENDGVPISGSGCCKNRLAGFGNDPAISPGFFVANVPVRGNVVSEHVMHIVLSRLAAGFSWSGTAVALTVVSFVFCPICVGVIRICLGVDVESGAVAVLDHAQRIVEVILDPLNTDIFSEWYNVSSYGWVPQATANLGRSFDAENQAITVTRKNDYSTNPQGFTSANNRIYLLDLSVLKAAYEAGSKYMTFEYFSTLGNAASGSYYGFRVYYDTVHSNTSCGTEIITYTGSTLKENEWASALIDLETLFGGGKSAYSLSFVVCGGAGGYLMLRNAEFAETMPYVSLFDETATQYFWTGVLNCQITKTYDYSEEAMKLTAGGAGITNSDRHHAIVIDKIYFEQAIDKGYNTFIFSIKGDAAFVADNTSGFSVYSNKNALKNGENDNRNNEGALFDKTYAFAKTVGTDLSSDEYTTVKVNLSALLAREGMTGVGIWLGGASGSSVYIKGGTFAYEPADIFSEDYSSQWKVVNGTVSIKEFDNTENAFKFTVTGAGATGGARSFCVYSPRDELENALENGYEYMSFEIKVNQTFLDSANGDVRIYSHQTDGDREATAISGEFVYRVLTGADGLNTETYTLITVNIKDFLALRAGDECIGICLDGESGSCVYIKNFQFTKKN